MELNHFIRVERAVCILKSCYYHLLTSQHVIFIVCGIVAFLLSLNISVHGTIKIQVKNQNKLK